MAETPKRPIGEQPAKEPELLTPSEIAELQGVASAAKKHPRGTVKDVEDDRSGQLSPSHTPGRGGR